MSLFHFWGKKQDAPPKEAEKAAAEKELDIYSGMRVEVTTDAGQVLFVAKLLMPHGNRVELHQYLGADIPEDAEPIHAHIRGYSDSERKAVYMEGVITPGPEHIWKVDELTVVRRGNDRAFFRLETDIDATATMFSGLAMGERPCKLLNISVGGACISSTSKYYVGDKFLLKAKLLEDRSESAIFSQVVRVIAKDNGMFEYGCQFLELTEDDQERITQNIFTSQRKTRVRT